MTTTTQLTPDELTILKLAVRGRGVSFICEALSKPREHVGQVLARYGGTVERWQWAIDEHDADTTPRIPTRAPTPPARQPQPSEQQRPLAAVPQPQASASSGGKLEQLLTRSSQHDTAAVRAARTAVLKACDRLEKALHRIEVTDRDKQAREAEKAQARARVASLERQLREAKAALRGKPTQSTTNSPTTRVATPGAGRAVDYDARQVREWARANNVACPTYGRYLPAELVAAYKAAHPERTSA